MNRIFLVEFVATQFLSFVNKTKFCQLANDFIMGGHLSRWIRPNNEIRTPPSVNDNHGQSSLASFIAYDYLESNWVRLSAAEVSTVQPPGNLLPIRAWTDIERQRRLMLYNGFEEDQSLYSLLEMERRWARNVVFASVIVILFIQCSFVLYSPEQYRFANVNYVK